jgi:hypothetical protein
MNAPKLRYNNINHDQNKKYNHYSKTLPIKLNLGLMNFTIPIKPNQGTNIPKLRYININYNQNRKYAN